MTDITNFTKTDVTARTATTRAEITQYTVLWEDLTAEGFANGDDVIIIWRQWLGINITNNSAVTEFLIGTTGFGSATVQETFQLEGGTAAGATSGRELGYIDRRTLSTDEDFFWSLEAPVAGTAQSRVFSLVILKLGDLDANDWRYHEDATHTGNAPTTATEASVVTLPPGGGDDWLIIANNKWLFDTNSALYKVRSRIDDDAATGQMNQFMSNGDTNDEAAFLLFHYIPAAGASEVVQCMSWQDSSGTHDLDRSAIFALRMEAFTDHVGHVTQDAVAIDSTEDVFVETDTQTLSVTTTGDVAWFAQTVADVSVIGQFPYHEVEIGGTQLVTDLGRHGFYIERADEQVPLTSFAVNNLASGSQKFDVNCTENLNAATTYNFDGQVLAAFSLELAGTGGTTPKGPLGLPFKGPFGGPL